MIASKPINITTSKIEDYNLHCQAYKSTIKPFYNNNQEYRMKKKPMLLQHPNQPYKVAPQHSSTMRKIEQELLSQSYTIHEDELLEEMKCMVKNHKLAKQMQKESSLQNSLQNCLNEETRRLFVSNALTMKFLQENDVVLVTISEELQISQIVDAGFHLRVGKIVKNLEFHEECIVELFSTNEKKEEVATIPSFCLCLEDRVLFDRMQQKRNKMVLQRKCQSSDELASISMLQSSDDSLEKSDQQGKPKRKFKSC